MRLLKKPNKFSYKKDGLATITFSKQSAYAPTWTALFLKTTPGERYFYVVAKDDSGAFYFGFSKEKVFGMSAIKCYEKHGILCLKANHWKQLDSIIQGKFTIGDPVTADDPQAAGILFYALTLLK